jgi:hypothetical protein
MTTGYSTLTKQERLREVRAMKEATDKINSTPRKARAFLIAAVILSRTGKGLAPQYR